jgi:penicillin-binding protein 1A
MKKVYRAGAGILAVSLSIIAVWVIQIYISLPDVSALKHYRPSAAAEVLDRDGRVLAQYYDRKFRVWVPVSSLPDLVIHAVVTAEDDTFFEHKGFNYQATWDAFLHDVQKGRFARGGSTITQQMIKNVLLSREKTLSRKLREFFLAQRTEDLLTKREIIEIYLNEVEWGENIYGIEAASRFYFDKHATELTTAEAALLAGMLPNPRFFNPAKRMDKARDRQERVISNMLQAKLISEDEFAAALRAPLRLRDASSSRFDFSALSDSNGRPCYRKVLEQTLLGVYGEHGLYRQGLRIRTTLDKTLQERFASGTDRDVHGVPDQIITVEQVGEIKAFVCSSDKDGVRSELDSLGAPYDAYDILVRSPDSIGKDEIVTGE